MSYRRLAAISRAKSILFTVEASGMMRNLKLYQVMFVAVLAMFAGSAGADVLELRDGRVLDGQYMGGTQTTVRFQVDAELKVFERQDIVALTFSGVTAASGAAPAPVHSAASDSTVVPAGTVLLIRTSEEIGTHNKTAGQRFTGTLEGKLMAGDATIAPSGATVHGMVVKSEKGGIGARRPILELTLTDIMIDGQVRPVKTSVLSGEGPRGGAGKKILKGSAVGALANGSDGAETGAKIGAGIAILGGGAHAGLQGGSLIEFTLVENFIP